MVKFSLPPVDKDAGPHKYQPIMPPNTAKTQAASKGPGSAGANATFNSPKEHITGFHGSPASYTPKALPKPMYSMPKVR